MSDPTPTAEQIVASPANAGDLAQEMKQVAQPFGKLTLWLAAIVVLAVAFGGGVWTHAALAGTSTAAAPARAGGQPAQATGQTGAGRQGAGGAARGTTGTIDRVEGTTVYVKTQQGTEVAVSTSDTTKVDVATPGAVADLKPGATIVVQGATGTDGKVTAQTITQSAPPAG